MSRRLLRALLVNDPGHYLPAGATDAQVRLVSPNLPALPAPAEPVVPDDVVTGEIVEDGPRRITASYGAGGLDVRPAVRPNPEHALHVHAQTVNVIVGSRIDASTRYSHRGRGGHLIVGSDVGSLASHSRARRTLALLKLLFRTPTRALVTLAVLAVAVGALLAR